MSQFTCPEEGCNAIVEEEDEYCGDHVWFCANDADSDLGECGNAVYGKAPSECESCQKKRAKQQRNIEVGKNFLSRLGSKVIVVETPLKALSVKLDFNAGK